jgi:transposase
MQELRDIEYDTIKAYLQSQWVPNVRLGSDSSLRRFLNGAIWILYSGSQLRELPETYGHWNTVYKRFSDWGKLGVWQGLLKQLASIDSDLEYVMVDSTVVRAHACCSTGQKKRRKTKKG